MFCILVFSCVGLVAKIALCVPLKYVCRRRPSVGHRDYALNQNSPPN